MYFAKFSIRNFAYCKFFCFAILVYGRKSCKTACKFLQDSFGYFLIRDLQTLLIYLISFVSRSTDIQIKFNFWLGIYAPYILNKKVCNHAYLITDCVRTTVKRYFLFFSLSLSANNTITFFN